MVIKKTICKPFFFTVTPFVTSVSLLHLTPLFCFLHFYHPTKMQSSLKNGELAGALKQKYQWEKYNSQHKRFSQARSIKLGKLTREIFIKVCSYASSSARLHCELKCWRAHNDNAMMLIFSRYSVNNVFSCWCELKYCTNYERQLVMELHEKSFYGHECLYQTLTIE